MIPANKTFRKLILVCTNERADGTESCGPQGGAELHSELKAAIKAVDPTIRVSKTGCLGSCKSGITVVIMPDNIWLGDVTSEDIPELVTLATK